jgi:hypothetical protein
VIKAVFLDRVEVVASYDQVVHSPSFEMRLPSVVALKQYVPQERPPAFTRFNLFLRDSFSCQYCGSLGGPDVRPRDPALARRPHDVGEHRHRLRALQSQQGRPHAARGGHAPFHAARRPSMHELQDRGRRFPPGHLHVSWLDYLYWDIELEA